MSSGKRWRVNISGQIWGCGIKNGTSAEIFTEPLLCSKYSTKHFTYAMSLNVYNNLVWWYY